MANELEGLAENLAGKISGNGGIRFEKLIRLFSTDAGKRILASLIADGGDKVKRAAVNAGAGDMSGVQDIIASIAETEEGRALLSEFMKDTK